MLFANLDNPYHSGQSSDLRSPCPLSDTMYIETNLSSQHKINIIRELFDGFGFDYQDLKFLVRQKQKDSHTVDLSDKDTYFNVPCGELAYRMFAYLLENNRLSQNEINNLITKDYPRKTFKKVVYPVFALSRDANRGDSRVFRYYTTPINAKGLDIYISSQWFEESREDLVSYFERMGDYRLGLSDV